MGKGLIFIVLLLSGCASMPGNWCDVKGAQGGAWRPSKASIPHLDGKITDQMLTENKYGQKHCGWKK